MMALPRRPTMSVEEYLELDRRSETRYEYIDGYAHMLAGGTGNHATISFNVARILWEALRGGPCRMFISDMRVRLSVERYVYPDISVTCDARDQSGTLDIIQYPRLIVEVLSPSTEAYDRGKKFAYYRACSTIEEYVLIDPQRPLIEVYRREQNSWWTYHAFESSDIVELLGGSVRFPVDAAYEDIVFPPGDAQVP
jgi:Uma2 family endonuclease